MLGRVLDRWNEKVTSQDVRMTRVTSELVIGFVAASLSSIP